MRQRFTNRQLLVVGIVILCFIGGIGLLAKHPSKTEVAQDTGGAPYVTIKGDGAEDLYTFFVYDDYRAVTACIADYIIAQGGKANGTEVDVSNVVPPYRGNTTITTFKLSIPSLHQNDLAVAVDIPTDSGTTTFSIEKSSYKVDLHTSGATTQ